MRGDDPRHRAHRRDDGELVLDIVEHRDDRRAQEQAVGQAEDVRIGVGQPFHQPHHVVAHVAEQACRHRRQPRRQLYPGLLDDGAQRSEGSGLRANRTRGERTLAG
jgi:hypothetical protein